MSQGPMYRSDLIEGHNNYTLQETRRTDQGVPVFEKVGRPVVVCLCGSTRFKKEFQEHNFRETLAGKIVLSIGCAGRSDAELFAHLSDAAWEEVKTKLDELHLWKIRLADEVLILNVGQYIGESTQRELDYARKQGKLVRFLEEPKE